MPEYLVIIPIAGTVSKYVEAASEKEAIKKAMDCDFPLKIESEDGWELDEIDMYEHIFQGNISYIETSEAVAEVQE